MKRCASQVAEGRKRSLPPSALTETCRILKTQKTYETSKLNWDEQSEGKHAEMLAWVKALIKLRRSHVCFNDGDMHHLLVSSDDEKRTLVMERDEARVLINFGEETSHVRSAGRGEAGAYLAGGAQCRDNRLDLPPMTLAVLMSPTEEVENRQVALRKW